MLIKFCVDHPRPVQGSRNFFEDRFEEWSLQLILNYTILLPLQQFSKLNFLVQIAFLFISSIRFTTSQQSTWNSSTVRQSTAQAQNSTASSKHQRRSGSKLCVIFGVSERNGTESGPNGRNSHRHRKHHRPSFGHGRWRRRRLWWVIRGALTYRTPPHSKVDDDVSNGFPPQGNHFFCCGGLPRMSQMRSCFPTPTSVHPSGLPRSSIYQSH